VDSVVKATIESKTGAVITVEGSEAEVVKVQSDKERANLRVGARQSSSTSSADKRAAPKREGVADLILRLRDAGFFDGTKTLGELEGALEAQGCLKPTTTLSGVVLKLVKKKELQRKKVEGRWVYGK
jgi:hypothetical protein